MRRNSDKAVYAVLIIMGLVSVISLVFSGVMGTLYIKEQSKLEQVELELETEKTQAVFNEAGSVSQAEMEQLLAEKETEVEKSIKEKMKEIVSSKDGGPITMLRYFFPENLVFYDDGGYVFEPILESLKKHDLLADGFIKNQNDEMEYWEGNTKVSHKGIDVSKYQGKIDWEAVRDDGVEYAFIRLGIRGYESGKIVLDDRYEENMRGANAAGVNAGVYFFTQAVNVDEAMEEAEFVLENLADFDVPCPVVLDVEAISGSNARADKLNKEERTQVVVTFCEAVKEAGYVPMIYGNVKCFTRMLDMTLLEEYEKWYAFYDEYMYFPYEVSVWQYTEKGTVNGIKESVDLNISYKLW